MDENKLNKEDKNFVERIIKEIDDFLSAMSKEKRRIFFIEMGFKMTEEEKSIINEPAKYLREAAYTGKQFQPGPLHRKTVIEDSKTTDANHDLTAISESIEQCQVAAELESAANPTIYSGNNEQPQNNMEESDIVFANKIIEELDEKLSKMSDKERKEFFNRHGIEVIEDDSTERKQQLINLLTVLKAVLQIKLKYAKELDPLQYYEYKAQYGRTEATRIMARIKLDELKDKYSKPEVVGTRITEEPYAYDANRTLGSFEQKHRYVAAQEIAAQGDPKKQIIYGDKSKEVKKTPTFEDAKAIIDFMKSKPKVTLKGTRHIPTKNEIEAMQKAKERINEGNRRELEAKAVAEKEGIVYGNKAKETSSANKRHQQLIRLKAYLASLFVLNERQQLEQKTEESGMDEFVKDLGLQQVLITPEKPIPPMTPEEYAKLDAEIAYFIEQNDKAYGWVTEHQLQSTPGPDQQYKTKEYPNK